MNYIQLLFSYFNAPLFATFIIGMFWKRSTPRAGFAGLVAGTVGAFITHELYSKREIHFGSDQSANFGGAIVAFLADAVVTVVVSLVTQPKPVEELRGLVWGTVRTEAAEDDFSRGDGSWYRSPALLGGGALVLVVILNVIFI